MLQPVMHILNKKRIVLASGSPRRKELIENLGLKVRICPSKFAEDLELANFKGFSEFVEETALQKVMEVKERLINTEGQAPDLIIGADTVVTLGNEIFGKPTSEEEALTMLTRLANKVHTVFTGVVIDTEYVNIKFTEKANVYFGEINIEQIQGYIKTGEPMDKAGGYGIQGMGGTFVKRVEGDYFTVVGLPLYRLCTALYDLYNDDLLL